MVLCSVSLLVHLLNLVCSSSGVCFIYAFDQTLAEQLYHDKGLLYKHRTWECRQYLAQSRLYLGFLDCKFTMHLCLPTCNHCITYRPFAVRVRHVTYHPLNLIPKYNIKF